MLRQQQVYPGRNKAYCPSKIHPTIKFHNLATGCPWQLSSRRLTFLSAQSKFASDGRPSAVLRESSTAKVYKAARNADSCRELSRRSAHIAFDTCPRARASQFSLRPTGKENRVVSEASVRAGSRLGPSSEHTRRNSPTERQSSSETSQIVPCHPSVFPRRIQAFPY